jgi:hypothetical protein
MCGVGVRSVGFHTGEECVRMVMIESCDPSFVLVRCPVCLSGCEAKTCEHIDIDMDALFMGKRTAVDQRTESSRVDGVSWYTFRSPLL